MSEKTKKEAMEALNQQFDSLRWSLAEMIEGSDDSEIKNRIRRLKREVERTSDELNIVQPVMVRVKNENGEDEQHEVTFPIYGAILNSEDEGDVYWKIENDRYAMVMTRVNVLVKYNPDFGNVSMLYSIQKGPVDFLGGEGADYWLGRGEYSGDEAIVESAISAAYSGFGEVGLDIAEAEK